MRLVFPFLILVFPSLLWAKMSTWIDPETQLKSWKLEENGVELELIQRLPDQSRAFFQGRGFSSRVADEIGNSCILQVIARNNQDKAKGTSVTFNLQDWLVKFDNQLHGIKLKETWDASWSLQEVNQPARLAFRWATFPTQQTFDAGGDYNWGMVSIGLTPGDRFDLQVNWTENSQKKNYWIKSIHCADDR